MPFSSELLVQTSKPFQPDTTSVVLDTRNQSFSPWKGAIPGRNSWPALGKESFWPRATKNSISCRYKKVFRVCWELSHPWVATLHTPHTPTLSLGSHSDLGGMGWAELKGRQPEPLYSHLSPGPLQNRTFLEFICSDHHHEADSEVEKQLLLAELPQ